MYKRQVTATAIAKRIGIFEEGDLAVSGPELEQMTDEELDRKLAHISVYARVSPEHKIRIVTAWQRRGQDVYKRQGAGRLHSRR